MALKPPYLLIAAPTLQDSNFWHAIILMVEDNPQGSLGFIINRPSEVPLSSILNESDYEIPANLPTWNGGPVGLDRGLILSSHEYPPHFGTTRSGAGFSITSAPQAMQDLSQYAINFSVPDPAKDAQPDAQEKSSSLKVLYPYRFIVGYAGWGAEQLATEVRTGSWLEQAFDRELVFNTPWMKMWDEAIAKFGMRPEEFVQVDQEYLM